MTLLIAQTAAEHDGVNLLPLIVVTVALIAAAVAVYVRRRQP